MNRNIIFDSELSLQASGQFSQHPDPGTFSHQEYFGPFVSMSGERNVFNDLVYMSISPSSCSYVAAGFQVRRNSFELRVYILRPF